MLIATPTYAQERVKPKPPPNKVSKKPMPTKAASPKTTNTVKNPHSTKGVHTDKQKFDTKVAKPASGQHKTKKGTHHKKGVTNNKGMFKL